MTEAVTDSSAPRGTGAAPPPADDDASGPAAPDASPAAAWEALLAGRTGPVPPPGAELVERYGPLVAHRGPLVLAQLGQSLDGFIASRTGHAEFVTGPEDREHLHRLRALVEAVVVGVGTVVADDCRLTVRAVPGPHPTRVVLDPSARAPLTSAVLTDGAAPTLWVVGEDADAPTAPAPHVCSLVAGACDGSSEGREQRCRGGVAERARALVPLPRLPGIGEAGAAHVEQR